jgi:TolB-like protein
MLAVALIAYLLYSTHLNDSSREPTESQVNAPPVEQTVAQSASTGLLPHSVAVLPFENLSPEQKDAYFAAGLHEEVLNQLAKIRSLNVIARATMRQYENTDKPFRQIAKELNVETVMEGNVRYADGNVRFTAQLINPETDVHLWSETYEHEFKNIFAIESDIAMKVAGALAANFSLAEREAIERVPTQSSEAYALYLEASALGARMNRNGLTLALAKINQALALDPEFALGWTLKAGIHSSAVMYFPERLAQERIEEKNAIDRSIEIDPDLPEAHNVAGSFALGQGDWLRAQAEMDKAIALGGSIDVSLLPASVGHIDKALRAAIEVQQSDPLNVAASSFVMVAYSSLGDTQAVLREYARGKVFFPDATGFADTAVLCLLGHGNGEQAMEIVRNDFPKDSWYTPFFNDTATVEQSLSELRRFYADDAAMPMGRIIIAALAAFLGDQQLAMRAIKASLDETTFPISFIWQPVFRDVRQLDEFKDYMREIGLVEYWRQYGWPDLCQPVREDDFECS